MRKLEGGVGFISATLLRGYTNVGGQAQNEKIEELKYPNQQTHAAARINGYPKVGKPAPEMFAPGSGTLPQRRER